MIDGSLYLAFVLVSAGIIVMPGPNVLLIMATSLSHGHGRGLQTVAGTSAAMLLQLIAATLLTASLAALMAAAFDIIKWLGVAYLVYLGLRHLRAAARPGPAHRPSVGGSGTFWRGFMVSLTNPKTLLFFGAFLPQFVEAGRPVLPQVAALSATFLALAVLLDSGYALAAGALRGLVRHPRVERWRDGGIGMLFVGAGIGLALTRRG